MPANHRTSLRRSLVTALTLALMIGATVSADATPLALNSSLESQGQGLSLESGGVGLESLGNGSETLTVNIGGPVETATLYWAGRELVDCENGSCFKPPNTEPFGDQELEFDSTSLTGTIIGIEDTNNGSNIAYSADVTSIVDSAGTGAQSFTIEDGNLLNNIDRLLGAGLLVTYTDPAETQSYRVMVAEGADFAFHPNPDRPSLTSENHVTAPVTFTYAATAAAITAISSSASSEATSFAFFLFKA